MLGATLLASGGDVFGWSLLDEMTVIDPNLSAEVVWEIPDSKTYCQSAPQNLDRLACQVHQIDEFWIGVDAAGNRYGTINAIEPLGDFFDIYRRPAGTDFNHHIARITKRVEPFPAEVTKLSTASRWEVDVVNGAILIGLQGQCLDNDCMAEGDTGEHIALLRITGLPILLDIVNSYVPPTTLSFAVPRMPEGLPTGDQFDVFTGDVATLSDGLSLARPLACDVAAGAIVGERVDMFDPLPDPAPGQARYYLTVVTSGAERRAGRRREAGVLSGRSVQGLPACAG
jgi:hypothetical protein